MSFLQLFSNCTICSHCNIFCRTWRRGWEQNSLLLSLHLFFLAFGAEVGSEAEEERRL